MLRELQSLSEDPGENRHSLSPPGAVPGGSTQQCKLDKVSVLGLFHSSFLDIVLRTGKNKTHFHERRLRTCNNMPRIYQFLGKQFFKNLHLQDYKATVNQN